MIDLYVIIQSSCMCSPSGLSNRYFCHVKRARVSNELLLSVNLVVAKSKVNVRKSSSTSFAAAASSIALPSLAASSSAPSCCKRRKPVAVHGWRRRSGGGGGAEADEVREAYDGMMAGPAAAKP